MGACCVSDKTGDSGDEDVLVTYQTAVHPSAVSKLSAR